MLNLQREPDNCWDKCAVAIIKADGTTVGHMPYNLAPLISPFLARDCNKDTVEITGKRVNRGAGYGLEVPCVYHLYGPKSIPNDLARCCQNSEKDHCCQNHLTEAYIFFILSVL